MNIADVSKDVVFDGIENIKRRLVTKNSGGKGIACDFNTNIV